MSDKLYFSFCFSLSIRFCSCDSHAIQSFSIQYSHEFIVRMQQINDDMLHPAGSVKTSEMEHSMAEDVLVNGEAHYSLEVFCGLFLTCLFSSATPPRTRKLRKQIYVAMLQL